MIRYHEQNLKEEELNWMSIKQVARRTRFKVRPHRTRSAAADCGLCPLRQTAFCVAGPLVTTLWRASSWSSLWS